MRSPAEERRFVALNAALMLIPPDQATRTSEGVVEAARVFEGFLRGDEDTAKTAPPPDPAAAHARIRDTGTELAEAWAKIIRRALNDLAARSPR